MKYAVGTILAAVAVVLSFQNCKKNMSPDDVSSFNVESKVNLNEESPTGIVFFFDEIQSVQHGTGFYQLKGRSSLGVDLSSGVVTKTTEPPSQASTYCMTSTLKAELNSLLATFQVCRFNRNPAPGEMCTQVLIEPYAEIVTSRESFAIGSASDGCRSNSVELCGEAQTASLKSFAEKIQINYKQLNCPN